ncbi:MAG TPA: hypothetical protein VF049_08600 [Nocardioidaceae bacterium]|jgi:hypothetical protein
MDEPLSAEPLPAELEERIRYYERPENDPGPLSRWDWTVLALTGLLLPAVCLVLGWFVGW